MYDPLTGARRQSEWDDHGEEYSMNLEGPDLWIPIEVPAGVHRVTMYFMNKDGHDGHNRFRDYLVEISKGNSLGAYSGTSALARARIVHFWGGVYKQFVVAGPGKYNVRVARNYSFNTICVSVLIDTYGAPNTGRFPCLGGVRYAPPGERDLAIEDLVAPPSEELAAARQALKVIDGNPNVDFQASRTLLYRAALRAKASEDELAAWRWKLLFWKNEDRVEFKRAMEAGYRGFLKANPSLATKNEF